VSDFHHNFLTFHQFSPARLTWLPVSIFDDLDVSGKFMMSSSKCHKSREESDLGP
jgi:hypothetical protein